MSHTTNPTDDAGPVVDTAEGSVRGMWRENSAAFLGVPFAEAPVGELRFAAPVPRAAWDDVLQATSYASTAQIKPLAEVTAIPEPSIPGDDILAVNVFTPAPGDADAKLPVFVWIHGGGYVGGSPASPWYDGFAFNRDGVVTVTLAYRLGFEGFGWIDGMPQNRGLLDQIEALRWVRRNIAAFGGDPDNVTIGGQSAGGGSVIALLSAPSAQGLFHAAIAHSAALEPVPVEEAKAHAARLAELAGVAASAEGFGSVDRVALFEFQQRIDLEQDNPPTTLDDLVERIIAGQAMSLKFAPMADGVVLDLPLDQALSRSAAVPLIAGTTAHEFSAGGAMFGPLAENGDVRGALARTPYAEIVDDYFAEHANLSGQATLVGQLMTDALFRLPLLRFAAARGEDSPTWLYDFRYCPEGIDMAGHCAELPFAWDNLGAERVAQSCGDNPPQSLADAMHTAWVSFIRTHAASWTPWDADGYAMVFDTDSQVRPAYLLEREVVDL